MLYLCSIQYIKKNEIFLKEINHKQLDSNTIFFSNLNIFLKNILKILFLSFSLTLLFFIFNKLFLNSYLDNGIFAILFLLCLNIYSLKVLYMLNITARKKYIYLEDVSDINNYYEFIKTLKKEGGQTVIPYQSLESKSHFINSEILV